MFYLIRQAKSIFGGYEWEYYAGNGEFSTNYADRALYFSNFTARIQAEKRGCWVREQMYDIAWTEEDEEILYARGIDYVNAVRSDGNKDATWMMIMAFEQAYTELPRAERIKAYAFIGL